VKEGRVLKISGFAPASLDSNTAKRLDFEMAGPLAAFSPAKSRSVSGSGLPSSLGIYFEQVPCRF
jgi:hypothetical protein